jgi:hypothetical protein
MENISKGDLMKKIFTKEELRNIDAAVPNGSVPAKETFYYIMDYNKESVFGKLVDMREEAAKRGITLNHAQAWRA